MRGVGGVPWWVRYADGGGVTPAARRRRETVRMQAAGLFAQKVELPEVARRLWVSRKSAYRWHRMWREGGEKALASRGPSGSRCRPATPEDSRNATAPPAGTANGPQQCLASSNSWEVLQDQTHNIFGTPINGVSPILATCRSLPWGTWQWASPGPDTAVTGAADCCNGGPPLSPRQTPTSRRALPTRCGARSPSSRWVDLLRPLPTRNEHFGYGSAIGTAAPGPARPVLVGPGLRPPGALERGTGPLVRFSHQRRDVRPCALLRAPYGRVAQLLKNLGMNRPGSS
ncbi:helix-turn-helix domain-containing protein [Streptomyces sp. NPDC050504]|uniref:helix-turn-helix domain-containing protein n=1 Tax=Streptomyces sp. NPDC050504 TaxID=3365618 RepID=UPI0037AEB9FB